MNHQAFLQAIREEPADDVPRLVYADWLEDNGLPDRAELIRVQCELTRGTRDRAAFYNLLRRLRDLVVRHRPAWLGLLATLAPDALFERGFVDRVSLSAERWLANGAALLEEHPIHRLTLNGASALIAELAGSPLLAALSSLDLDEAGRLGDEGVQVLCASPHLGRLHELGLPAAGMRQDGMQALARSPLLGRLTRLSVPNNLVSNAGVAALAASPLAAGLVALDLSSNDVGLPGAQALATSPNLGALRSLRVPYNRMGAEGIEGLLASPHLAGVARIDAWANGCDELTVRQLRLQYRGRLVI
jgi:uncharacterized protein (TIGR02996 family)